MYFKLALSNIRKSYKDYLVYFLTVSFGICLFYLFNSLESQKAMMVLDSVKLNALDILNMALSYVSTFMTIVLAFLMVYANQFLIKRRKKELGIYMTLGMERFKISYILVLETFLIGIISLMAGLILGIIGSHFLSILTAKMFLVDMKEFQFIFSEVAFTKSILIFGFIYLLVMVLNVLNITRVKLIDLIYGGRKNQNIKVKSVPVSIGIFLLSLISLGFAYYCINKNGMMSLDIYFKMAIGFGLLGTFLFFMSLSGIMLQTFKLNKRFYYKNLNMFSLRQINSKVNTTYIMISVLCILLLIAIGTFSTGMGIASVVNDTQDRSLPFDMTLSTWLDEDVYLEDHFEEIRTLNGQRILFYDGDYRLEDLADVTEYNGSIDLEFMKEYRIEFIGLSDYNNYLEMSGRESVSLENGYILTSNMEDFINLFESNLKPLTIGGTVLEPKAIEEVTLRNEFMLGSPAVIVLPDELVTTLKPSQEVLNYQIENFDVNAMHEMIDPLRENRFFMILIRDEIIAESLGFKTIISYVALYVGLVFIMSTVACLALQQLSEASDNASRYNLLKKLGVENNYIRHSLLVQIAVYFFMPLGLAIIHSIVGIKVSSEVVNIIGKLDILKNMIITTLFVVLIYGSYFIVTYTAASAMVIKFNPIRKE